jgi:cell division protein FtsL
MKNKPREEVKPTGSKGGSFNRKLADSLKLDEGAMAGTMTYLVVFVVFVIVYIANSHYHVKTLRHIKDTNEELKEIQAEYVSLKAELANKTKASEMAKKLESKEIKELRKPPFIIEDKK